MKASLGNNLAFRCFQRLFFPHVATQHCYCITTETPLVRQFRSSRTRNWTPQLSKRLQRIEDRTVSRRSEPSSRTALTGEQPDPWDLLQPQDAMSRHRGAKLHRRYELLDEISLLSLAYLLSVKRRQFHFKPPDHFDLLSHLLDLFVLQLSLLMPMHSTCDCQPHWASLRAPPLLFRRIPPQ